MLRAVKLLDGAPVPIIGVNVGLLGYLTEVEPPALTAALERWAAGSDAGEWRIEERMMLDATLQRHRRRHPARDVDRAERGSGREAGGRPHRSAAGAHRRRGVHVVRRRRADHRHADRLDGVLAVGARAGRVAEAPRPAAHAGVAAHAVRPHARARSRRARRDRGASVIARRRCRSTASRWRASARATSWPSAPSPSVARFVRFGERRFHQILKTKFGLSDR